MSWEDRYDAMCDHNAEIAAEAIGELSATDICDLFLTVDFTDLQRLEMIEALIDSLNQNGHNYRLEGE